VTSGQTNHLDLLMSEEMVIALVSFWNRLVHQAMPIVLFVLSAFASYKAIRELNLLIYG
jgi:hypothetical protein